MIYTIRALTTYAEMLAVHRIQQEVWGLDDPAMGLYPPLLLSASKNGGSVLGAFDAATGEMVGFLFGYLGRNADGLLKLCSQTMGIKQAWRDKGLGEALKRAQFDFARAAGLPLIIWTYDPLEGRNAYLNLGKLRATSRTYWRSLYGEDLGALNRGLPTDRLLVEWWTEREPVVAFTGDIQTLPAILVTQGNGLQRHVATLELALVAPQVTLEIPASLQALKTADAVLALDWRLKTRAAFEAYFEAGYSATHFVTRVAGDQRRNFYVLTRP